MMSGTFTLDEAAAYMALKLRIPQTGRDVLRIALSGAPHVFAPLDRDTRMECFDSAGDFYADRLLHRGTLFPLSENSIHSLLNGPDALFLEVPSDKPEMPWKLPEDTEPPRFTAADCRVRVSDVDAFLSGNLEKLSDPERRLATLRELGGSTKWTAAGKGAFKGTANLVAHEKAANRPRSDEKIIRADLCKAAEAEYWANRQGPTPSPTTGWPTT